MHTCLEKLWLSGLLHFAPSLRECEATYFEKADAHVTGGRCEVLVIVKVDIAQAPGMCKLLSTAVKNPRTAQVPAWPGEREVAQVYLDARYRLPIPGPHCLAAEATLG